MTRALASVVTLCFALACETTVPFESGKIWCSERYLTSLDAPFDRVHLEAARRGYIYALASALTLQHDDRDGAEHRYRAPERLRERSDLARYDSKTGFEAHTFELRAAPGDSEPVEWIIAFSGSNDRRDWWGNLRLSDAQHHQARRYLQDIAASVGAARLVVAGYSLAGALAAHVARHPETSSRVAEAWLFNPSPTTYAESDTDARLWMLAAEGEALRVARWPLFRVLPGVVRIGAPANQTAEHYYLVEANPAYQHFRWTLTQELLHVADLAIYEESGRTAQTTEPLEILRASPFAACSGQRGP